MRKTPQEALRARLLSKTEVEQFNSSAPAKKCNTEMSPHTAPVTKSDTPASHVYLSLTRSFYLFLDVLFVTFGL